MSLTLRKLWLRKVKQTSKVPQLESKEWGFKLRKPDARVYSFNPYVRRDAFGGKIEFHPIAFMRV